MPEHPTPEVSPSTDGPLDSSSPKLTAEEHAALHLCGRAALRLSQALRDTRLPVIVNGSERGFRTVARLVELGLIEEVRFEKHLQTSYRPTPTGCEAIQEAF